MEDFAIKVENVSKVFHLPHEKNSSIKSAVINFYSRKKGYELQEALNNISFEVKKGEFFGIVGRNGSGKSTMLKLLAGIYIPTQGQVHVRGSLTPFIELGVGFNQELTGRENVYLNGALLGFGRQEMRSMYEDIVEFAELERFMDQKLKNYSSGMQVRLAFSIAIRAKSDILLIDEVLAVGDADFQRKCYDYFKTLKKEKKTVILVSHDMGAVKEFCNRAVLIEKGKLAAEGPAREVADKYSQLFIQEETKENREDVSSHIGSGEAVIEKTHTSSNKKEVIIQATVKVKKPIEGLQYGIHINSQDGSEITAMNNRTLNLPDLNEISPNDVFDIEWRMTNIFNDGKFYVTLVLADGSGKILDRFEDAASFRIKRPERSNTSVLPPLTVKITNK